MTTLAFESTNDRHIAAVRVAAAELGFPILEDPEHFRVVVPDAIGAYCLGAATVRAYLAAMGSTDGK